MNDDDDDECLYDSSSKVPVHPQRLGVAKS